MSNLNSIERGPSANRGFFASGKEAQPTLLVIDQDRVTANTLDDNFKVIPCSGVSEASKAATWVKPDAIVCEPLILDRNFTLCRQIRELPNRQLANLPVVVVTELNGVDNIVWGLNAGADQFLAKPAHPEVLRACLGALIRRYQQNIRLLLSYEHQLLGVKFDVSDYFITKRGAPVSLTPKEREVLILLASWSGSIVTYDHISRELGFGSKSDTPFCNELRVWIYKLRQKLEDDPSNPQLIKTHNRLGYSIQFQVNS